MICTANHKAFYESRGTVLKNSLRAMSFSEPSLATHKTVPGESLDCLKIVLIYLCA